MPIPSEFYVLQQHLPPTGWFIAGGSLLDNYNDIDIYFESEADYQTCLDIVTSAGYVQSYATSMALTFAHKSYKPNLGFENLSINFQFIIKSFGTPEQILSEFDLNKSRQAVLPSGKLYQHYTFFQDLYFEPTQFRYNTLDRLFKYVHDKHQPLDLQRFQSNMAQLLADPDATYGYYYEIEDCKPLSMSVILNRQFLSNFVVFGWLLPVFESMPAEHRLALYQDIITPHTEVSILPSMSAELQTVLTINDQAYRYHQTRVYYPDDPDAPFRVAMYKFYPPQTPTVDVWSIYPELFI